MNDLIRDPSTIPAADRVSGGAIAPDSQRVLRNTWGLLSATILFSAGSAWLAGSMDLPAPNPIVALVVNLALLFAIHAMRNSGAAIGLVFVLTGFMGYSIGPVLAKVAGVPGGAQTITLALAMTGGVFVAMSAWAVKSRRDFSFMAGFLLAGMVIAILAGLAAWFFEITALSLAVCAMVALLSSALILMETSRIVHGGETNYVLATVGLYVSVYNLFSSLLALLGVGQSSE